MTKKPTRPSWGKKEARNLRQAFQDIEKRLAKRKQPVSPKPKKTK